MSLWRAQRQFCLPYTLFYCIIYFPSLQTCLQAVFIFFLNLTNGDAIRLNGQILDTCLHKMQPLFSRLPVPPSPCSDTKLCRSATYGAIHWAVVTCVTWLLSTAFLSRWGLSAGGFQNQSATLHACRPTILQIPLGKFCKVKA